MTGKGYAIGWIVICATILVVLGLPSEGVSAEPVRTWTDASGRFKIEAKYVSFRDGTVKLQRTNGQTIEVPLDRLCEDDRRYVAQVAPDNPFMTEEDRAALQGAKGSRGSSAPSRTAATASPNDEPAAATVSRTIDPVDWEEIRKLDMPPPMGEWSLSTAAPGESKEKSGGRPMSVPPPAFVREGVTEVAVSPAHDRAVIGYTGGAGATAWSRFVSCKLSKAGRATSTKPVAGYYVPVGLCEGGDGKQILVKGNASGAKDCNVVGLWRTKGLKLEKIVEWSPYSDAVAEGGDSSRPGNMEAREKIRWASLLSGNRAATMNETGQLVIWDLEAGRAIYGLEINGGSVPAVSDDQKYLAFGMPEGIGVLDLKTDEVVVRQDWPGVHFAWPQFRFSPSGKRLYCMVFGPRILVWDCTNGQLLRDVKSFSVNMISAAHWVDDEYLLLSHMGTHYLFNVTAELPIWAYEGADRAVPAGDLFWFLDFPKPNAPGFFLPAHLPHPAAQDMLAKSKNDPKLFLLAPGKGVRLSLDACGAERPKVEAALTKQMQERGFKIDPSSPIELVASSEPGEAQKISVRMHFGREGSGEYTVQPVITRLKLVHQGKELWQATSCSGLGFGGFIHVGENQTVQDVINERSKPDWTFVDRAELPKRILSPDISGALGKSNVTELAKRR